MAQLYILWGLRGLPLDPPSRSSVSGALTAYRGPLGLQHVGPALLGDLGTGGAWGGHAHVAAISHLPRESPASEVRMESQDCG